MKIRKKEEDANMKKIISTLLCLALLIGIFSACKIESPAAHESKLAQSSTFPAPQEETAPSEAEHTTVPSVQTSNPAVTQAGQSKPNGTLPAASSTSNITSVAATAQSQQPTAPPQNTISVQVEISCAKAVGHSDLKAGIQLPSDGTLLHRVTLQIGKKESAFFATKTACEQAKLYFGFTSSAYGNYVNALGPLSEKDCGSKSGWLYSINGITPSKSADQYKLAEGDIIRWEFTLS